MIAMRRLMAGKDRARRVVAMAAMGALTAAAFATAGWLTPQRAASAGPATAQEVAAGADPAAALTGDITFSVPSGTFQGQVSVQMSTDIAGAEIRYTTDGTVPTATSIRYQNTPLVFTKTTQLRAQVVVAGAPAGTPGTAIYVARSINATHDLPLLVMDAYGRGKPGRDYRDVSVMVMDKQGGSASLAQLPTIATRAGFHLRGQSSANFEKAPYRLELWDNDNSDADYPILGMPADSDWVLRGPYPDKSLIRDALAYGVGRQIGLQAPRYAFVELYLNLDGNPMTADDYQGVYLLDEAIKRSPDRLNIAKLKKTDLAEPNVSGGYILQINMLAADPPTLTCTPKNGQPCWSDLEVVEPDELQPEQQTWITNYIQKFHDALRSSDPANPQTGYPAYIDVDSFVNIIIANELARSPDGYVRSMYFYKDRGGKLVAGPLWDYDIAFAAYTGFGGVRTDGWQYQTSGRGGADWFAKLMQDPTFLNRVKARWQELRRGVLSNTQLGSMVTALATPLASAAQRNFQRWPILNTAVVGGFATQTTQTWDQQLQIVRDYLTRRAAWLDSTSGWGGSVSPTTGPTPTATPGPSPTDTASPEPTATTPAPGGKTCTAAYSVVSQWPGGFQADVRITAGSSAINGWTVAWSFTGGQTVTQAWNATVTTSSSRITATNMSYNGALNAGASTSFGLTGTWNTTNSVPTASCTAI